MQQKERSMQTHISFFFFFPQALPYFTSVNGRKKAERQEALRQGLSFDSFRPVQSLWPFAGPPLAVFYQRRPNCLFTKDCLSMFVFLQ